MVSTSCINQDLEKVEELLLHSREISTSKDARFNPINPLNTLNVCLILLAVDT